MREGRWLVGMGKAGAIRGAPVAKAGARGRLDRHGVVMVETDMTDIGTGSYTTVQQTAAEMMGVPAPVSTNCSTNPTHALQAGLGVAGHTVPVSITQLLDSLLDKRGWLWR